MREQNRSSSQTSADAPRHNTNLGAVGTILLSVLFAGCGQLIFKAALNDIGELELSVDMFISMATSPLLLLGLAVFGVSAFLWLIALMKADLSFAFPFISLSYVIVLLGGAILFDEKITALRMFGFVLIVAGIFVVARGEASVKNRESEEVTP